MKNRLPILAGILFFFGIYSQVQSQTYNVYFGDIHSHTWYSDGNQDQTNHTTYNLPVARGLTYAKSSPNMNFLGISDHNHIDGGFPMTLALWRSGVHEADSVNQDGTFVGMYGQEWGTTATGGGHSLIYGTSLLFGWNPGIYDVYVAKNNFAMLVDSVKKYNGFIYFAHPATDQFGNIFTSSYNASWDSAVQGVAMKNGPSTSTNTSETDPSSTDYTARYHDLLRIGYHVAPCANQDNHNTTYGRVNQQRTAVLATSLTQANIVDALRNRRAYATEDHNLQLKFEVGTHQMGEIFTTGSPISFRVKVVDPGETINKIELRYGIPGSGSAPTALTSVTSVDSLIFSQSQSNGTTYYYYAYVLETDGSEAWSAPMWITASATPPPTAFSQTTPSNNATGTALSGSLTWGSSTNATGYDVYLSTSNPPATLVSSNQAGLSYSYSGLQSGTQYYWKVVARNSTSTLTATGAPWNFTTVVIFPDTFSLLSPSNNAINRPLSGNLTWNAAVNALTYDVYFGTNNPPTTVVSSNQAGTSYAYGGLANNTQYFWKVVAKNGAQSTTSNAAPWNFTTALNAPGSFSQLLPSNNSLHNALSGNLSWQSSSNATGYDVYFGTSNPPSLVSTNQPGTTFPYGPLTNNTLYYWKVVAKNITDSTTATGAPWNFTTMNPPGAFTLLSPDSASTGKPLSGSLSWSASASATSYDVYLDVSDPPTTKVDSNVVSTSYVYNQLLPSTIYFWKIISKNVDGTEVASNAPWGFTTINVPLAPTDLVIVNDSVTSLMLQWNDTASNEDGYRVYRSLLSDGPFDQIGTDLPPNTESFSDTGLSANERYYYLVTPFNVEGDGISASINGVTLAYVPGMPALTNISYNTMTLVIDPAGNSAVTQLAVQSVSDSGIQYAQADGSVGGSPVWKTFAEWGGASGIGLHGLYGCTVYSFHTKARNSANIETAYGTEASDTTGCLSASSTTMIGGWNLVSVPITVEDLQRSAVFPTSASSAFAYEGSYVPYNTLSYGTGYWMKFNGGQNVSIPGEPRTLDTITVKKGWSIIGSISASVPVGSVTTQPNGIIASSFYSYDGIYHTATSIDPMKGYWVKTSAAGDIILSGSPSVLPKNIPSIELADQTLSGFNTITFEDNSGHRQILYIGKEQLQNNTLSKYELPPVPPNGFDVRFGSQRFVEILNGIKETEQEFPITVQSTEYPVTVSWNQQGKGTQFQLLEMGSNELKPSGTFILTRNTTLLLKTGSAKLLVVPKEFALYQNYPNPFNPSTQIRYDLPEESFVQISVYNVLGVKIASLVNGKQEAGPHAIEWRPDAASGVYFYRIEATRVDDPTQGFQQIKRMLLMK